MLFKRDVCQHFCGPQIWQTSSFLCIFDIDYFIFATKGRFIRWGPIRQDFALYIQENGKTKIYIISQALDNRHQTPAGAAAAAAVAAAAAAAAANNEALTAQQWQRQQQWQQQQRQQPTMGQQRQQQPQQQL